MKREFRFFGLFFGLFVVIMALIWLFGCGQDSVILPTEDDVGSDSLAAGQNNGSDIKNYIPFAGVQTKDGSRQLVMEDALKERLPDAETLRQWAKKDPRALMAPSAMSVVWYKTNAVFTGKGTSGLETQEGTCSSGRISFKTAPNNLSGVSEYWIEPRLNSASGSHYWYLKLSGKLPTHVYSDRLYFKVDDNGNVYWLSKGDPIYSHTIIFENCGVVSSRRIYVRGVKSTANQWQLMDYLSNCQWQYKPVLTGVGRESLEFKDDYGNNYRFQAIVDGVEINYYDRNNNWLPTFEYTATGVRSLGSNIYDLDLEVADDGGVPPTPPPSDEVSLTIVNGKYLQLYPVTKTNLQSPGGTPVRVYFPNSQNQWQNETKYSDDVSNDTVYFDLNTFAHNEGQVIRFGIVDQNQVRWLYIEGHQGFATADNGDTSLVVVYKNGSWRWWKDVYGNAVVPEIP